jgi:L-threonylcarbamoyladenylate synthase
VIKSGTDINFAAQLLKKNKVVGIPTETVYGLAANAYAEEAILSVFKIKNRPFLYG